jgi:uncharacterized membrane protein
VRTRIRFKTLLKRHFLAGLLIVIPIFVIGWMLGAVIGVLWRLPGLLPGEWQPDVLFHDSSMAMLVNMAFTILSTAVLAIAIAFVGWVSKHYLGRKILLFLGEVISRIPLIRSVYSALEQLMRAFGSGDGRQFSRVVYIQYPSKASWAIAFVTGEAKGPGAPANHLNVYVPTTPNPTSGFHLLVPENEVRDSPMSVEEAFKTILSLGIAQREK